MGGRQPVGSSADLVGLDPRERDALAGIVGNWDGAQNRKAAVVFCHAFEMGSGANHSFDITVYDKVRVIDVVAILQGAGTTGSIITVSNDGVAITDAEDVASGGDKAIFRFATIDDVTDTIPAGGTLRCAVASTGGDFPGAEVYVSVLKEN